MSNTANLVLPYLAVGQAQKHVTVNEALRKLDAIIQLSVVSATTAAQPASPADGAVYVIPSGKSGADWSAFADGSLGYYRDGAWVEISPREGWLAYVKDTDQLLAWSGSAWSAFPAAKILSVSATDKLLGRSSAGTGAAEEIACTAAGRALIDDADASAQRTTLGLGTAATQNTGTSGANVPLLNGVNTWSGVQTFSAAGPPIIANVASGTNYVIDMKSGGSRTGYVYSDATNFILQSAGAVNVFSVPWSGASAAVFSSDIKVNTSNLVYNAGASPTPGLDNIFNVGSASFRFAVVYAATGTINTSDAREKTALRPLGDAERRAIRRVMQGVGVYQWLDSITAKGQGDARLHVGVTAQAVADAFTAEGLDASRYGLFCSDPLEEDVEIAEDEARPESSIGMAVAPATTRRAVLDDNGHPVMRLGVRYDQLFAMALATLFS